jgi:murein DD-endopeptidase MepM/ murein hydrolase activator NlpD
MAVTNETAAVDAMLDAAGLSPAPAEREQLLQMYNLFKPGVEALYALPEARYEAPALVFQAEPKLTAWGA